MTTFTSFTFRHRNGNLKELPTLPHSLRVLSCGHNQLETLPTTLPNNLRELFCEYNQLKALPTILPNSLISLGCYNNQLTALPTLPNNLLTLACGNNQLTALPTILPNSLITLSCEHNQLKALPTILPNSLITLECDNNELTTLPHLPNNLQILKLSVYQVVLLNIDNIPISTVIEIVDENEFPTEITSESEQRYETINNRITELKAQLGHRLILNCPRYTEITKNSRNLKTIARRLLPEQISSLPEDVPINVLLKGFLGGKKSKRKSKRKSNKKKRTTRKRK